MVWKKGLPLLLLLTGIGLIKKDRFLIFGIVLLVAIFLVIKIWNKYCFSKLTIKRSFARNQIFLGEETHYLIQVENRKPLPILWLQINDLVSKGVEFLNHSLENKLGSPYNVFKDVFSLKWYEKVTRRYPVKPERRGYFTFGKGELHATDLLGYSTQVKQETEKVSLLVYPKILPLERLGLPRLNPFGVKSHHHWLYQDPSNRVGSRPYQQGDPFNQINWKASARYQQLYSNEVKPTVEGKIQIILNSRLMNHHWEGFQSELFELAVTCAASVAEYCFKEGYHVGFLTNGIIYQEASFVKLLPGKSKEQRERVFKALAMIEPLQQKNIEQLVFNELSKLEMGTTLIFITCIMNQQLINCLRILAKKGYRPVLVKIGESIGEGVEHLKGLPVYYVSEEKEWNEINEIQFVRKTFG